MEMHSSQSLSTDIIINSGSIVLCSITIPHADVDSNVDRLDSDDAFQDAPEGVVDAEPGLDEDDLNDDADECIGQSGQCGAISCTCERAIQVYA